jgi:hypothetical protein
MCWKVAVVLKWKSFQLIDYNPYLVYSNAFWG